MSSWGCSCTGCTGCSGCGSGCCACGSSCKGGCTGCSSCSGCSGTCRGYCDNVCSNTEATGAIANLSISEIIFRHEIEDIQSYATKELKRRKKNPTENTYDINKSEYHNKLFQDMKLLGLSERNINSGMVICSNNYKDAIALLKQKMAQSMK